MSFKAFKMEMQGLKCFQSKKRIGILLPELFRPTVRKNCSTYGEKSFEIQGQEFAKILRSLEQFIKTVKGRNNFGSRMLF